MCYSVSGKTTEHIRPQYNHDVDDEIDFRDDYDEITDTSNSSINLDYFYYYYSFYWLQWLLLEDMYIKKGFCGRREPSFRQFMTVLTKATREETGKCEDSVKQGKKE